MFEVLKKKVEILTRKGKKSNWKKENIPTTKIKLHIPIKIGKIFLLEEGKYFNYKKEHTSNMSL